MELLGSLDPERGSHWLQRWGERFLGRVLTEQERNYVLRNARPAKHLAVRLAAKEAVYKALQTIPGARQIGWKEIEVERTEEGRPEVRLHGVAHRLAESAGVARISLSLTHTEHTAAAVALTEGR